VLLTPWQPTAARENADRDPNASLALGGLGQPLRLVLSHPALTMLAGTLRSMFSARNCYHLFGRLPA
jgi:hypothetical protein